MTRKSPNHSEVAPKRLALLGWIAVAILSLAGFIARNFGAQD